jgi:hypothetical protein
MMLLIIHTLSPCLKMLGFYPSRLLLNSLFCSLFKDLYRDFFLCISFNNTWITIAVRREEYYQLELCNDADLYVPFARTTLIERQPLTKFPKTWHEFPNENVKFIRNKQTFNEELKKHFLSKLDANYRCVGLLCPHCHLPDGL